MIQRSKSKRQVNYFRSVLSRLTIKLVIFTVVFFLAVLLVILLYNFLVSVVSSLFADLSFFYFLNNNAVVILTVFYVLGVFIICLLELRLVARGVMSITRDIDLLLDKNTELLPLPDDLKATELALQTVKHTVERNELAAKEAEQRKNDLVVYLAHDLKTPLTSVVGYLSILQESPELPLDLRQKYTAITLNKAYRLEQLINEFFEITRYNLQSIELSTGRIDLSTMLHQMGDEFSPILAEKDLHLVLDIQPGLQIIGDSDKLARVFDNVLRNAVNYSYPHTTVRMHVELLHQRVLIRVRNCGDMIPQLKLDRIFEKFYRADDSRSSGSGGAGLGLSIARHIIELHNGSITAESNPEYTEFTISLPVSS